MKIFYTEKATRQLKELSPPAQKRVISKMRFYAKQKNPLKFAERLTDYREGEFRFRIGDFRVIFDVVKDSIYVLKIGQRDKIYG